MSSETTGTTAEGIAAEILERTGGDVRLGLPLGLGKAVRLVNALTELVARTPEARLSILTALTLQRPSMSQGMARRLLEPAADRLFGTYPDLTYAKMQREGRLPPNIDVSEFFMQAGSWLGNAHAQQSYMAANYTHARDMLIRWRPNVVLELLAEEEGRWSLSCNPDITADLLRFRDEGRMDFLLAGERHPDLPFFGGAAEVRRDRIDLLLDDPDPYGLFQVPKRPVGPAEHAIGLHVARLVEDGGTLQIGIGAIGDAIAHSLILRHEGRAAAIQRDSPFPPDDFREEGAFAEGLYGVTEMLVDGLLQLFEAGILRREAMGAAIHAGFFVDCGDFYERLRALPRAERDRIAMVPVSFTNALYVQEDEKRQARRKARFVNAAMKATCLGGIVSDVNSAGREVSGVGGQFNFVEQAFALEDARAVLTLNATRTSGGKVHSNIVWEHPHETVPRQYRDVVVTEYGIADLRGKTDAQAVAAMIAIADSRFQEGLAEQAKAAGKLPRDYEIPAGQRANTPRMLLRWLTPHALPEFPFGADFDATERRLLPALSRLKMASGGTVAMARLLAAGMSGHGEADEDACLDRMGLTRPRGARERLEAILLRGALRTRDESI